MFNHLDFHEFLKSLCHFTHLWLLTFSYNLHDFFLLFIVTLMKNPMIPPHTSDTPMRPSANDILWFLIILFSKPTYMYTKSELSVFSLKKITLPK